MFRLVVEFSDGSVNEWLCDSPDDARAMLRTLDHVRGFEITNLGADQTEP